MPPEDKTKFDFLSLLRADRLFYNLPPKSSASLKGIRHPVEFKKGVFIWKRGELPDCLYLLLEGQAKMCGGNKRVLHFFKPCEILCLPELINQQPCRMNISTVTDCRCESISRADFLEFLKNEPEVSQRLARLLGTVIRKSYKSMRSPST